MMYKTFLLIVLLFSVLTSTAQVGVGTEEPTTDLEVNGNTLIQGQLTTGSLDFVKGTDENFKLLTRLNTSEPAGQIGILDVSKLDVAPVNVIDYHFKNIRVDNLRNVDLQYDADKYVVGLSNFRYEGAAIKKRSVNGKLSVGNFVTRLFIEGNTWHLEIQNRFLDLESTKSVEYFVSLVVYDKSYYRNLPEITTDLKGSNVGVANTVPNLY